MSKRPGTRMTRADRVKILLTERTVFGRPLLFTERPGVPGAAVHVVGPDEDQPAYTDLVDHLMNRRVRTVCGFDIRRTALQGTHIGAFEDNRLCWRCHRLFGGHAWKIFDDNTEDVQGGADAVVQRVRRDKQPVVA